MTKAKKRAFIKVFCRSVERQILAKVDKMPEDWDGIEIREYIADEMQYERWMSAWNNKKRFAPRLRAYKRAKAVL